MATQRSVTCATTGQFSALSIEALKFSLGIFTREARQKDHMLDGIQMALKSSRRC